MRVEEMGIDGKKTWDRMGMAISRVTYCSPESPRYEEMTRGFLLLRVQAHSIRTHLPTRISHLTGLCQCNFSQTPRLLFFVSRVDGRFRRNIYKGANPM